MRIESGTIFKYTLLGMLGLAVLPGLLNWRAVRGRAGAGLQTPSLCKPWGPMCEIHNGLVAMQHPPADFETAKSLARNLAPALGSLAEAVHGSHVNCNPAHRLFVSAENSLDAAAQAAGTQDYETGVHYASQVFNEGVDALAKCGDVLKFGAARYDLAYMKVVI